MMLPKSDRTRATEQRYQDDKIAGRTQSLLDVPVLAKLSEHWYLKYNEYPYDERWQESLMYVYYKACSWEEMPLEHVIELHEVKIMLKAIYDKLVENGHTKASVSEVPHGHLLRGEK